LELLAVLLALLVLSAPIVAIAVFVRQHRLRVRIEEVANQTSQRSDALHRELLELRRQVSVLSKPSEQAIHDKTREPLTTAVPEKPPQTVLAEKPSEKTERQSPQPVATTPRSQPPKSEPAFCAWCGTFHAGGVSNCPSVKPAAPQTAPPKPEPAPPTTSRHVEVPLRNSIPLEAKAPVEDKPADKTTLAPSLVPESVGGLSPVLPSHTVQSSQPQAPSAPQQAATAPPKPPTIPSANVPLSPRPYVTEPPQFSVLHASQQKATARERIKSVFAMEEILGRNWFAKIGITLVVLGLAWFGIQAVRQLGPRGKAGLSYLASFALLGGGVFFEKRERYRILGRTLIGGGWALLFFTTYALNHVQAMRVLESETADLVLMLAVALGMVVHTLRYRSQLVTGLAFLLAYTTVSLSHDTVYSLASGVILAFGLVCIVLKLGWFELEVFGILAAYLDHLYWLDRLLGPQGAQGHGFAEYQASTALLLFYWAIFRVSYVVRKTKSPFAEHISTAAALLNTVLLLVNMKFQSVHPELTFIALLTIGAAEFTCGQLPMTRRRREAFVVLTVMGSALMIAAVPFHYSGNNTAILWLIAAEALLVAGVVASEIVFRRLALLTGYLVALHIVRVDFMQLMSVRNRSEEMVLSAGIMFSLCALTFYINSLYVGQRWKSFFFGSPDAELLVGHSYIGAFAAASAVWALCSHDWTALAFLGVMLTLAGLGKKLKSHHLQLQYGAIGLLTLYRVAAVNLHTDTAHHLGMRIFTLPVIAAGFYVTAKWAQLYDDSNQRIFRGLFAVAGTGLLTALIDYEVPELWQAAAAIAFAIALVEIGQRVRYYVLAWHAHALTGIALLCAITADRAGVHQWHDIPIHAFGALPVVAGAYWIAGRISLPNSVHSSAARIAYSWAGTGLMLWVLNEAVPSAWITVAWIAFAIALALVMRRIGYKQLAWQANVVAGCAVVQACVTNFTLQQRVWPGVSLRILTISMVAAGLYFLSRAAVVSESPSKFAITYLHTFAATALLTFLAWFEAPGAWLAAVWAVFALALAILDRRFEVNDLRWQAHALAALSLLRSVSVNLYISESWHGISVRLLSLAIVAVVMYALAQIFRMPQQWRAREFHHIYSWAASAIVSLLVWYELQPLSIAVAWGVFGLVLFEYGLLRNVRQFRFQAYVALAAHSAGSSSPISPLAARPSSGDHESIPSCLSRSFSSSSTRS
jgi:Predicted membrane protein (DUF2339)